MKTLLIGDLHLTAQIVLPMVEKKILAEKCDQVIFLGDYTDAYYQTENTALYLDEVNYLFAFKEKLEAQSIKVIMLLGNHDASYLTNKPVHYSLRDVAGFKQVREKLLKLDLQIAYELGDFLVSHAGYTVDYELKDWHFEKITENSIEHVEWLNKHVGISRGGNYISGSPIWADAKELSRHPNEKHLKQIIGHTPQHRIQLKNLISSKAELIFIDTFTVTPLEKPPYFKQYGTGEILLHEDDHLQVVKLDWRTKETIKKINEKFVRGEDMI
ncbi:phosphoesterase [Kurthia zopfii]|uniref:Phosphoesterase n=1 Tax=Kurthia zopfii TaxID=1650 RepID=A0A8B4QDN8_9BACL|nr:metallophosphoesterase [Kurthia zopfii]PWI22686.1 serine/threonine protein phosphatase [Kurthia zopfii]TDR39486.1 putative phosphoesterase [Kurthia zopfii]GEK30555.1 phosphoesterase [Kurthia zopfii]STX10795.1 Uncharacterized protein conserved in bacteria [Kurthia zopfii]